MRMQTEIMEPRTMKTRIVPGALTAALLAILTWGSLASLADEPKQPAKSRESRSAEMALPEYNEAGGLLRPEGYERWTLVGTSIGVDYSKDKDADADKPGIFHNVYMQPEAFDHYVATGEFPEQTVFVVTNNPPTTKGGEDDINRRGLFADDPTGLEVSVKDSQRFDEGWGYFMYYGTKGPRSAAKPLGRTACYDCHAEHGEDDAVFVQFYSVLKAARARKLQGK